MIAEKTDGSIWFAGGNNIGDETELYDDASGLMGTITMVWLKYFQQEMIGVLFQALKEQS